MIFPITTRVVSWTVLRNRADRADPAVSLSEPSLVPMFSPCWHDGNAKSSLLHVSSRCDFVNLQKWLHPKYIFLRLTHWAFTFTCGRLGRRFTFFCFFFISMGGCHDVWKCFDTSSCDFFNFNMCCVMNGTTKSSRSRRSGRLSV